MTVYRTPILKSLASKFTVAVFLTALGTLPNANADDSVREEIAECFVYDLLLMGKAIDSSLPGEEQTERLALTGGLGIESPQPISSAPFARSTANTLASHGVLVRIAGTAGSAYCDGSSGVALDPSGKFAYMSGGIGLPGRLCGFKIDLVTLAWTPVTPPGATPVAVGSNPRGVAIEPSGRFVYVAGTGGVDGIMSGFAIDRVTGVPTPLAGSPFATGGSIPTPVVIDRSGRFMYVGQSVGSFDGSIAVFAIDATTGALSHIPGSPFPNVANGGRIAALALTPDGRFLFTGGSSLGTYEVNSVTGVPTRIAARAGYYYGLTVDPTGRFLFGTDDTDGLLRGFSIAANGALAPAGAPQAVGPVTRSTTAIVSVSDLVYVGNYATGKIYGFIINPSAGALTPVAGSPFAFPLLQSAYAARVNLPPAIQVDVGDNVVATVGVYGGRPPYAWSVVSGALPPGSTLNATTGVFSGTLNTAGAYSFTVGVTDSLGASMSAAKSVAVGGGTIPAPVTVVEFYNASLDHYFITYAADEIAKLDNGMFKGWARTGLSFKAFATAQSGTSAVCRIYIPPGKGDGHYFGRDANECDGTMAKNPTFVLESSAFFHLYPPTLGICAAGQVPVYRVYSNRADANHRYTTDRAVRDQMVGKGWLAEGDGADTVVMCAPA
jgi:6-phosphogluconolactonase (cycloisomerase 2 family)